MIFGAKNTATSPSTLPIIPALPSSWPRGLAMTCAINSWSPLVMNPSARQRGRNLLSGVREVANQVEDGGDIHYFESFKVFVWCRRHWSVIALLARACSPTERAEDRAHKRGGKHDGSDPDDARPHRCLSLLRLVGTTTRCRINDCAPHEGEHSYRD